MNSIDRQWIYASAKLLKALTDVTVSEVDIGDLAAVANTPSYDLVIFGQYLINNAKSIVQAAQKEVLCLKKRD